MRPVRTERSNFTYKLPGDTTGKQDLPCRLDVEDGQRVTFSTWELTSEERIAIAEGANIELGIWWARPIPPVSLTIDSTPILLDPPKEST